MTSGTPGGEPGEREPKVIPVREALALLLIFAGLGGIWWGTAELAGQWGLVILSGVHVMAVGAMLGLTRNVPGPSVQPPTTTMTVRPRTPEDGPARNHT